jgi:oxygen-independent coproporphyrinogen-3 oxidase
MKLLLIDHDYKYAVEQIMLSLFPQERPEYDAAAPDGLSAEVRLSHGNVYATAHTRILGAGTHFDGYARVKRAALTDRLTADRLLQRIVKLSFYKAAVSLTGQKPPWGALTGIRPGKLATQMLKEGLSEQAVQRAFMRRYFVSPERSALCIDTAKAAYAAEKTLSSRDIALYVGIPFCPSRCSYCSFVSHSTEKSGRLIAPFLDALFREIDCTAAIAKDLGLRIRSVYIGGVTRTTLTVRQSERLLRKLVSSFELAQLQEFTVEAGRADTITAEKLSVLADCGVTRISVNPQSMSDRVLSAIGRHHSAQDVRDAMALARTAGFACVNMDLIAGLPADTADGFLDTLDQILAFSPENITVHTLSLKKGSRVTLEETEIPGAKEVSAMLDAASKRLRDFGYAPYYLYRQKFMSGGFENVGWSKKGYENLYNICMMEEHSTVLSLAGRRNKASGPSGGL